MTIFLRSLLESTSYINPHNLREDSGLSEIDSLRSWSMETYFLSPFFFFALLVSLLYINLCALLLLLFFTYIYFIYYVVVFVITRIQINMDLS